MSRKSLDAQAVELALAVPLVWTHRVARLWLAGARPSSRDRREFQRMGVEKLAAFHESWNAMLTEFWATQLRLALSPLAWLAWSRPERAAGRMRTHVRRTANAVARAGLAPVHRRAVANAKRLGRTPRR